jgi:hypothetical protein
MDRKRFDALALVVGAPATRRTTITAMGALLLGLVLGETVDAGKKRKRRRRRKNKGGEGSGEETVNLCCQYTCDPGLKFTCIPNAQPGITRCDASLDGCSFSTANFVDTCDACGIT